MPLAYTLMRQFPIKFPIKYSAKICMENFMEHLITEHWGDFTRLLQQV